MAEFELKRFWETASAKETDDGFFVCLDDRPLKTPLKNTVSVPTRPFAEAIAAEWQGIEGKVQKQLLPFTRLAEAALDGAAAEHAEIVDNLTEYGATDCLCYRAESPVELAMRQAENWDPVLQWAETELGVALHVTQGITAIEQPASSLQILRKNVAIFDLFQLTAFYDLVKLSGSLMLALAVTRNQLNAVQAWELSRVDENWQIEQWGVDDDAQQLAESKLRDFKKADAAFKMLSE